jgi:hypothetical protein
VDYGAGKGKAMFVAADYPFKRIIGVEYAKHLHAIARANCESFRSPKQQCKALEAVHADVLDYRPPDGPIVCFMCNPFDQATLRRVFDGWRARFESGERDIQILYLNMRNIAEIGPVLEEQRWLRQAGRSERHIVLVP